VWLSLTHPEVATRSCDDCKVFRYDEKTGCRAEFLGKPIKRFPGELLPCQQVDHRGESCCKKISPEADVALWPHNAAAYEHYRRCKAVCRFPEDSLVEANAAIIAEVEAAWESMNRRRLESGLMQLSR